ncbi:hypothetical protein D3C76_1870180 [compost metagenome]
MFILLTLFLPPAIDLLTGFFKHAFRFLGSFAYLLFCKLLGILQHLRSQTFGFFVYTSL